jgi:GntR family transcriptional repressor for pyruvate dehydrogenase complex
LGVNRSSVREALRWLEFLELIEVRHGQGSFVRDISGSSALQLIEALLRDRRTVTADLLRQILEFRRHITVHVVELAARNRTPELIERARALLAREAQAGSNPEAALELDVQMNTLLGEATGNLMYQFLTNLFTKLIRRLGPLYYNDRRDHSRSLETHHQVLAALESGDAARARRILEIMLSYSEAAILAELERLEAQGLIGPDAPEETS